MIIIGIDPGVSGAIAIMRPRDPDAVVFNVLDLVDVVDMPTISIPSSSKKNRREVDAGGLAKLLCAHEKPIAFIEQVMAAPRKQRDPKTKQLVTVQMGAVSAFNFGQSYMAAKAVCAALAIPYVLVQPKAWKKVHGLTGTANDSQLVKERSRQKAIRMYPLAPLGRKKDQNRAEAILIACAGYSLVSQS